MVNRKSLFAGLCALALFSGAALAGEKPIQLWPNGAPGSEGKTAPEMTRLFPPDEQIISSVHFPSITPFLPDPAKATGAAVIVIPGGGDREIWSTHEGTRVAQFLARRGIAAFVLKYRLQNEPGSTYTILGHSLADAQRAIRLVRTRAGEWHIDPNRIGVIGFSAGAELAELAATRFDAGNPAATDAVDRESSRPAFMGLIYGTANPSLAPNPPFPKDTPPAFLLGGESDPYSKQLPEHYLALEKAGVPAELHMLAGAGHGFGIRPSNPPQIAIWPVLFVNWLEAKGLSKP